MKLCLKQMSSNGTFNQTHETSMGFQLRISTMETHKPRKEYLKHTKPQEDVKG